MKAALEKAGAVVEVIAPHLGDVGGLMETKTFLNTPSVVYDAVYVPGGTDALADDANACMFVKDVFMHLKTIGATGDGVAFLSAALKKGALEQAGILVSDGNGFAGSFIKLMMKHRHWARADAPPRNRQGPRSQLQNQRLRFGARMS